MTFNPHQQNSFLMGPTLHVRIGNELIDLLPSSTTGVPIHSLEDSLRALLHVSKDDEDTRSLVLGSRHDAHLLECSRPVIQINSILGLFENAIKSEDEVNLWNPTIKVEIFNPVCSRISKELSSGPHDSWSIRSPRIGAKVETNAPESITFVDLRNLKSPDSDEDCCVFLRSVLGAGHSASPWGNRVDETNRTFAIVLEHASENLMKIRVGDACPSYFLHSMCRLQASADILSWWTDTGSKGNGEVRPCSVLIYRRLPPRVAFRQNSTNVIENLPSGCLWESYFRQNDDDETGDCEFKEFFRPVAPPYINHEEFYPGLLGPLVENADVIRREALTITHWTAWPETQHYSAKPGGGASWNVFPLCHCFPADNVERRQWIQATCSYVPETASLLQKHLGDTLRTALFSRLDPCTTLEAHVGWDDLANHVYRLHLPLVVPSGGLCGTWVDGCVETHETFRPLCFDDSKTHRAFNYSKEERLVLILDLARPQCLPGGTATGGHTEELDELLGSFLKQATMKA